MESLEDQRRSLTRLHTANIPFEVESRITTRRPTLNFITLAHQIGADALSVPRRLAEALNQRLPGEQPWSAWDRELMEHVAREHHIPPYLVEALEESEHSWIDEFLAGLTWRPDDAAIAHRIADTVRDLARRGRVVLVGHGSSFITRDLPGGMHLRLVAPLSQRIDNLARRLNLPRDQALIRLKQLERARSAFLKRFWPSQDLSPETFAATFNTAVLDEDRLVRAILCLLPG